jgi:hypothetical protein
MECSYDMGVRNQDEQKISRANPEVLEDKRGITPHFWFSIGGTLFEGQLKVKETFMGTMPGPGPEASRTVQDRIISQRGRGGCGWNGPYAPTGASFCGF